MPKVSICVPAYKDISGVKRLLDSLKNQDFKDFEVIITDDTPDDSIEKLTKDYDDLNIMYFHNDSCHGACENWNKSIAKATGEYIKIVHQDDFLTFPDSLSRFVSMLDNNPNAIMAFSGSRQVSIDHNDPFNIDDYYDRCISEENLHNFKKDYRDLYRGDWVGAPSATIYRNCDIQFDPALTWIIDVDFYMNLLKDGAEFECTTEPLISIGVSKTQLTNDCIDDADLNIREYTHVMKKYNLATEQIYRARLIQIAIMYHKKYKDIQMMGIPKNEYKSELSKHRKYLLNFYINLIKRKLFNGKNS